MSDLNGIVLVTGGSGFLGQHLIKLLIQEQQNLGIHEIRSVDLKSYKNRIGHPVSPILKTFIGDICKPETIEKLFIGVDCVFHCAALINMEIPARFEDLEQVNVSGTKNIVELCIKNNVPRLIYTSCASVNFVPYMGHSTFAIVINQTESKATTPVHDLHKPATAYDKEFLIPGYSSSKLRGERLVLNATGAVLSNEKGYLQTCALRPPLMYGEGDNHFMPPLLEFLSKRNNTIPRVAGSGGKHQAAYAGNVAWGHICAYKTLKKSPKKIAGLPAFITDDTPINDICRFIQRIGKESESMKFYTSWWYIPHFVFFFLAFMIETIVKFILFPIFNVKLNYSLRAISSFTSSVYMFNRLRASIHLDYDPIFDEAKSFQNSAMWYENWVNDNLKRPKGIKVNMCKDQ